ncbi:hypothetical protein, partial [Erwinia sp. MYb416]|uniref:hypothetical protein n=1 Tax=Erwinia sp. MYb416 TaxID=3108532 RepID=UPI0030AA0C54
FAINVRLLGQALRVFFSLTIPPDKHKPDANVQIVISSQHLGAKTSVLKLWSASFALSLRTV